jgi:hypothetical protein
MDGLESYARRTSAEAPEFRMAPEHVVRGSR